MDRTRWLWRIGNRWETMLLRRLGTSGMSVLRRSPLLVLDTTGRRTGRRRSVPVAFWTEDDAYYVGGGAAGMTRVDWVANLRSEPDATIVHRRRRIPVSATELAGADYDDAHSHALTLWPSVPKYEHMSGRRVPYFRLRSRRREGALDER